MFQNFLFSLDKASDVVKQQQAISGSISKLADSLNEIEQCLCQWPKCPTGDEKADNRTIQINIKDFIKAFQSFSDFVKPSESQAAYQKMMETRKKVADLRKLVAELKQSRASVNPRLLLNEAKKLRELLPVLRQQESEFIFVILHEWRAALSCLVTDLNDARRSPQPL